MHRSVSNPRPSIFRLRGLRLVMSVCVLALCGVALVPAAQAQFTQWNGSQNSDWFNAANWSNGVPDENTEVRINWFGGSAPVLSANTTIRRLNMGSNNQILTIGSGVTLTVNQDIAIGNSGTLNVADGQVIVSQASTISGRITVNDGAITFLGNVTQNGSSIITLQTGTMNIGDPGPPVVSANFTQTGGATFNLNQGTLNIYGQSEFTGGGTFNAGSGSINMNGDIQFNGGANFNPQTSTVTVSGSVNISSNSGQEATFYDLVIEDGSDVTASVNVTVNNNMTVAPDSDYENVNQTTLNVVGQVEGDPQIDTVRPYIVNLIITSPTSIQAVFNKAMNASTTQQASNYRVELQDGTVIDNMASSNPTQSDTNRVDLQLSFTIQSDVSYFLISNNLQSADGNTISTDHRKRFLDATPPVFFSRQTGFWDQASSWSLESHSGAAAPRVPGQSGDQVVVGNSHDITIRSSVTLAPLAQTQVNAGASLQVNAQGSLVTGTRAVTGQGRLFCRQAPPCR